MSDKKKRTFFGNLWRSVVKNNIPLGDTIVNAIDGGNALDVIKEISKDSKMSPEQKEIIIEGINKDIEQERELTKRWESDNKSQDWLPRNIRPLSLAFLTLTLFIYIILDSALEGFKIDSEWVSLLGNLLMLVYGGYFGARTLEKIRHK